MSQDQSKGFYEQRGMVRQTVIMTEAHKNKLKEVAKRYAITQGEVVEVLLDSADMDAMGQFLTERRNGKLAQRETKTDLSKRLKGLSPEKRAAIEAILAAG